LVYIKVIDFYMLILYPAIFQVFMMSRNIWCSFKGLLGVRSCHWQIGLLLFLLESL
jgi:hypothetical protein